MLVRMQTNSGGGSSNEYYVAKTIGTSWVNVTCGFEPKDVYFSYTINSTYAIHYDLTNSKVWRKSLDSDTEDDVTSTWLGTYIDHITNGVKVKMASSAKVGFVFIG